jgi:hypothetical protein
MNIEQQRALFVQESWFPVSIPSAVLKRSTAGETAALGTLINNLLALGFAPSADVMKGLSRMTQKELASLWRKLKPVLEKIKAVDIKMDRFVVYKNFPNEVLEMSEAQYWLRQIFIYLGVPSDRVSEPEVARDPLFETQRPRVLHALPEEPLKALYQRYLAKTTQWNDQESGTACALWKTQANASLNLSDFGFKANAFALFRTLFMIPWKQGKIAALPTISVEDATDVLRLAATLALPEGEMLRGRMTFQSSYKRSQARYLLNLLDQSKNLEQDAANRQVEFKSLLQRLYVSRLGSERIKALYDSLYRKTLVSEAAQVERWIEQGDSTSLLTYMTARPGVFMRRLNELYQRFGGQVVTAFMSCLPQMEATQLVNLKAWLTKSVYNPKRLVAPKGRWIRAQVLDNVEPMADEDIDRLVTAIDAELGARLLARFPKGLRVDARLNNLKLPSNHQKLAPYGQGTRFKIPDEMTFIRTASYWDQADSGTMWIDNGWLFFDDQMAPMGACCWDRVTFGAAQQQAAVFSGDPVITGESGNTQACQMIDLYLDRLQALGVRYAFWNILSYNGISFDTVDDIRTTLQWGVKAQAGKTYEPARAQLVFTPKSAGLCLYIAYIDLASREVVYLDTGLYGDIESADNNLTEETRERLVALMAHVEARPSLFDLVEPANTDGDGAVPCVYQDDTPVIADFGFVFKPINQASKINNMLSVQSLLQNC